MSGWRSVSLDRILGKNPKNEKELFIEYLKLKYSSFSRDELREELNKIVIGGPTDVLHVSSVIAKNSESDFSDPIDKVYL